MSGWLRDRKLILGRKRAPAEPQSHVWDPAQNRERLVAHGLGGSVVYFSLLAPEFIFCAQGFGETLAIVAP